MKTRRIISTVIALIMLMATVPAVTVFAREYAADVSINGVMVQFENVPYSEKDIIYVPLEEIGKYLNLDITKEGNIYSITRMGSTLKLESGNLVSFLDGNEVLLSTNPVEKNSVTYVPVDVFSKAFGCPVTISEDKRSADIVPNVFRVAIPEANAAAVSAAVADADILGIGTGSVDTIFNNVAVFPELEKSVFYKIDIAPFGNYKIKKVLLALNIDKSEYSPTLRIERTAPWKKGEVTYNTQPVSYEGEYVTGGVAESNYVDKKYDITTLANSAKQAGEEFSVKLMGIPHASKVNSKNNSFTIRGVNTAKAPYAEVYLDIEYTFPVKASAAESDNRDSYKYSELMLLKSLGVFTEKDEFPLDLNEGVQRQEFVKYALRLRNAKVSELSPEGIFTDVPKDSPFCNDIVTAYSLGLVSGGEGISFRPYDNITVAEAITILGRMLNYNIYAEQYGGFTPGYFAAARYGKLYLGSASEKGVLSFNKMFTLFEDALDAKMLDVQKYNSAGGAEYVFNESMTILSEYWDAKKIEGTVIANEYSNITPGAPGKDDTITIGTKELKLSFEPYNQFLGYKVRGWYNGEDELLYLGILDTDITEIKLQDIEGKSETSSLVSFSYIKENGNRKSESFSKSNVIYNGKSIAPSNVKSALLNADGGSIILVGSSLAVINAYDTLTVYSTEPSEEVIYDKYDSYNNVLRLKGKDYTISDANGKEISIEELKTDDILSVAKSLDGELIKAIVSDKKVTGTITLAENIGTVDQVLTIGGNEYETRNLDRNVADSIAEFWTDYIKLGANGTFLIDAFGNIVGFNPTMTTDIKGYILTMDKKGSALSKNLQAAIMVEGSEDYVVYDLADKIKIDGRSQNDSDVILGKFMETVEENGEEVTRFKTQGIIFDLDANGKINKIDTAYFDEAYETEENSLHLRRAITDGSLRYKGNGSLGGLYYVKPSRGLVVFCYEEGNLDEYQTKTSGLSNDGLYAFDLYTVGKETPEATIAYRTAVAGDSSVGDDPRLMLVDKVVTTFDDEGYEIKKLYYYNGTSRGSVIVPDAMVPKLKAKILTSNDPGYEEDLGNDKIVDEVSTGDIIRLEADDRGELTAIEEAYDYKTQKIRINRLNSFNNLLRTYGGYTGIVSGNYIKITLDSDISDNGTFSWIDSSKFANFCRYEVSSTGVDVIPAKLSDVRTLKNVPYNPTGILLQSAYENLRANVWLINLPQPEGTGLYSLSYSSGTTDNVGGMAEGSTRCNNDGSVTISTTEPTRSGYAFKFWMNEADSNTYAPGETFTLTANTVLTAQWAATPTHVITLKDTETGLSKTIDFAPMKWDKENGILTESKFTVPDAQKAADYGLSKEGWELVGWDGYSIGEEISITEDTVLEAIMMKRWNGAASTADLTPNSDGYYEITNGEELAWFASKVNAGNTTYKAKLMDDIYLNNFVDCGDGLQINTTTSKWFDTPANVEGANMWNSFMMKSFAGEFDGNGKTIYGLYLNGGSGTGFFSSVAGGTIKDVTFKGAYLVSTTQTTTSKGTYKNTANYKPVAIVAASVVTANTTSAFSNIKAYGKITAAADADVLTAGGIIGRVDSVVNLTDCTSYVDIIDSAKSLQINDNGTTGSTVGVVKSGIGGIIGFMGDGESDNDGAEATVTRCFNYGNLVVPYTNGRIGGIVGHFRNGSLNLTGTCGNAGKIRAYSGGDQMVGYRTSTYTSATSGATNTLTGGSKATYDPTEVIE